MPQKAKPITAKPTKSTKTVSTSSSPRRVKLPKYKPISLKKQIKPVRPPLTGAFRLFWRSLAMLKKHWQLFLGMLLIYAVIYIIFVHGLADSSGLSSLKASLKGGQLSVGFTLFTSLLFGTTSSSDTADVNAGVYEVLLIIIMSLAVIWALRGIYNNAPERVRDTFYKGMYPIIPFILVVLVIGVQLIPLLIGTVIYNDVLTGGIALNAAQQALFFIIFLLFAALSLFWVCSSVFALYIVTLEDMTPMKALRSARQLVRYRRPMVIRKILFLPLALVAVGAIIIVPISLLATAVAVWVFLVLSLMSLFVVHSYMYALYRELLRE